MTYYDIKYSALLWSAVGHQRASIGCTVAPLHLTISDSFCAWTVILIRYELDQVLLQALKIHADCSLKFTAHQWSYKFIQSWMAEMPLKLPRLEFNKWHHGSMVPQYSWFVFMLFMVFAWKHFETTSKRRGWRTQPRRIDTMESLAGSQSAR